MIDKNGKLFGKINIIDLIVVLVLVAAVAVFAFAKLQGGEEEVVGTFTMELSADEVYDYVTEHLEVGAPIYEADKHIYMGKVTSFEVAPARSYGVNSEGKFVMGEKEGFSSVKIVGEMAGNLEDFGATIDGEKFGVGHTFTCRVGKAKIYIKVSDIAESE